MNKSYFVELKGQLEHGGIKSKSDWAIVGMVNIPKLVADIDSLSEENKRLREALAFYADEAMYEKKLVSKSLCPQIEPDEYTPAYIPHFDKGYRARQTLGGETN